jgi:hypothetical protein
MIVYFDIFSLLLGLIGALLMWKYPLATKIFDNNGHQIINWLAEETEKEAKSYHHWSNAGPILLFISFLIQILIKSIPLLSI